MNVYRPILIFLSLLVSALISYSLIASLNQPQSQSQLNVYQSNLLLQASEWEGFPQSGSEATSLRASLLGENPLKNALENYRTVRTAAQKNLDQLLTFPAPESADQPIPSGDPDFPASPERSLESAPVPEATSSGRSRLTARSPIVSQRQFLSELDLRLGLLYAQSGQREQALQTWNQLIEANTISPPLSETAAVLEGLWREPPQILPRAEGLLRTHLKGWFRYQSLAQLYRLQQRDTALADLNDSEQHMAENAFGRLIVVGALPIMGSLVGVSILVFWGLRTYLRSGKASQNARAPENSAAQYPDSSGAKAALTVPPVDSATDGLAEQGGQQVPWSPEKIWQVMTLWFSAFFGVSYIGAPLVIALLGVQPGGLSGRAQAYFAWGSYSILMLIGFSILQLSLGKYVGNVFRWLQIRGSWRWIPWGVGGYLAALPIVLIVSLVNQKLLQEQGGGNPILDVILQSQDRFTIGLLFSLVAILAPVFEETLFRGFFLTSLMRYLPAWQAVGLSSIVFALAHLNAGDLLPLTVLGCVLGIVYLRSQNLLSSMLLHSLWNSGSFIGLLMLGGGGF